MLTISRATVFNFKQCQFTNYKYLALLFTMSHSSQQS